MKLLELMTGPWAILPETLLELQSIYATHLKGEKIDVAAVEARLGRPLASEQQRYELREGGVAVLTAGGVMAPKANLFMQVSGGISTQMLAKQFDSMAADARVRSVVFAPDSPGGNVLGVPAAAKALANLASLKPTVTVVEGVMASAMYWVGSAANQLYIEGETDMVGSLGVVQRVSWEPADPNSMTLVRGKYKRASINGQPPSAEYLAQAEQQLDYLYSLLVDGVAQHRGTTSELVLEHMADGRVFIGQQAIDAGLVDGVSTVDAMVEKLATNPAPYAARRKAVFALGAVQPTSASASAGAAPTTSDITPTDKGNVMPEADKTPVSRESLERDHAALFAALRSEFMAAGAAAETARVKAVLAEGEGLKGHQALVMRLALDGKTTGAEAAQAILAADRAALAAAAKAHQDEAPAAAPAAAAPKEEPAGGKTRQQLADEARAYAAEHKVDFVAACKALGINA
jgi:ClpP class serine protease